MAQHDNISILENVRTDHLDWEWLDGNGRLCLRPAEEFQRVPSAHLRLWALRHARYGFPTIELVQWLKKQIGSRKAIEIGAGNADLGFHLGITSTDSCIQQTDPNVQAFMLATGQKGTNPREDVVPLDAEAAVRQFQPEVVIASWVTRKFIHGQDVDGQSQASIYGVVEENIFANVQTYIHIGNDNIHGAKTLLKLPHRKLYFPWLVSRAQDPHKNVIYIWEKP